MKWTPSHDQARLYIRKPLSFNRNETKNTKSDIYTLTWLCPRRSVMMKDGFGSVTPPHSRDHTPCLNHARVEGTIVHCLNLVYFTSNIGKYACGSCGGSSTRSGRHRLKEIGGTGGSLDSE